MIFRVAVRGLRMQNYRSDPRTGMQYIYTIPAGSQDINEITDTCFLVGDRKDNLAPPLPGYPVGDRPALTMSRAF